MVRVAGRTVRSKQTGAVGLEAVRRERDWIGKNRESVQRADRTMQSARSGYPSRAFGSGDRIPGIESCTEWVGFRTKELILYEVAAFHWAD